MGYNKANLADYISLDEAMHLSREENRENHKNYVNPELVSLLGLIGFDKNFIRAEGTSVWDAAGNEYLDFLGGYGALNLGHNHPQVVAALEAVRDFPNLLQVSLNPIAGALARNLAMVTPGELRYCFFGNSGAEAVEGALKLARAATGRQKIISCLGSFHGKSFGALSVTGRAKYRTPFGPLLPEVEFVAYGEADALEQALQGGGAAAFIVEPLQGEGGIILPPAGYLKRARELCRAAGTLLIVDEVQTGFGRTGKMFACEHEGVEPDILCVAKSLGGGVMPLAAYIALEGVWKKAYGSVDKATLHTSTFGGNSRAAAAGIAALEVIIREDLAQQAEEKGRYLWTKLQELQRDFPFIKEVRGRGLMMGIEFTPPGKSLLNSLTGGGMEKMAAEYTGALVAGELLNRHRIITAYTLNNPNVIRLEPPLTVSFAQLDRLAAALREVLQKNRGFGGMVFSSAKTVLGALIGNDK